MRSWYGWKRYYVVITTIIIIIITVIITVITMGLMIMIRGAVVMVWKLGRRRLSLSFVGRGAASAPREGLAVRVISPGLVREVGTIGVDHARHHGEGVPLPDANRSGGRGQGEVPRRLSDGNARGPQPYRLADALVYQGRPR